jgi:hypothetical protein
LEPIIVQLCRTLRERPDDSRSLERVIKAVQQGGHVGELAVLLEWWANVAGGRMTPEQAVASLYCRLAERADADGARELARAALAIVPSSAEALLLFERHALPEHQDELRDLYRDFLRHAPFQRVAPRVRARLIDELLEAGRYDEALDHMKLLPPRSSLVPVSSDIQRACSVPAEPLLDFSTSDDDPAEHTQILSDFDIEVIDVPN